MAVQQPAGTIARLRVETTELHRRVEDELDLFNGCVSWLDYRMYLFRMYGFHEPIERALGNTPDLESVVTDAGLRNNKVALLAHDLVALGVERRDLSQLPRLPVPSLADLPEALGWMYVLEAATLDGKQLARQLASKLPLEIESASAYLGCYGDEVQARWFELGSAIDGYADREGVSDRIVDAAVDCYIRLHRWLKPSSIQARPARIHASG